MYQMAIFHAIVCYAGAAIALEELEALLVAEAEVGGGYGSVGARSGAGAAGALSGLGVSGARVARSAGGPWVTATTKLKAAAEWARRNPAKAATVIATGVEVAGISSEALRKVMAGPHLRPPIKFDGVKPPLNSKVEDPLPGTRNPDMENRMQKQSGRISQINGNNGSWTNTDDLRKGGRGGRGRGGRRGGGRGGRQRSQVTVNVGSQRRAPRARQNAGTALMSRESVVAKQLAAVMFDPSDKIPPQLGGTSGGTTQAFAWRKLALTAGANPYIIIQCCPLMFQSGNFAPLAFSVSTVSGTAGTVTAVPFYNNSSLFNVVESASTTLLSRARCVAMNFTVNMVCDGNARMATVYSGFIVPSNTTSSSPVGDPTNIPVLLTFDAILNSPGMKRVPNNTAASISWIPNEARELDMNSSVSNPTPAAWPVTNYATIILSGCPASCTIDVDCCAWFEAEENTNTASYGVAKPQRRVDTEAVFALLPTRAHPSLRGTLVHNSRFRTALQSAPPVLKADPILELRAELEALKSSLRNGDEKHANECVHCYTTTPSPGLCDSCSMALRQMRNTVENNGVTSADSTPEHITRKLDALKFQLTGKIPPVDDLIRHGLGPTNKEMHALNGNGSLRNSSVQLTADETESKHDEPPRPPPQPILRATYSAVAAAASWPVHVPTPPSSSARAPGFGPLPNNTIGVRSPPVKPTGYTRQHAVFSSPDLPPKPQRERKSKPRGGPRKRSTRASQRASSVGRSVEEMVEEARAECDAAAELKHDAVTSLADAIEAAQADLEPPKLPPLPDPPRTPPKLHVIAAERRHVPECSHFLRVTNDFAQADMDLHGQHPYEVASLPPPHGHDLLIIGVSGTFRPAELRLLCEHYGRVFVQDYHVSDPVSAFDNGNVKIRMIDHWTMSLHENGCNIRSLPTATYLSMNTVQTINGPVRVTRLPPAAGLPFPAIAGMSVHAIACVDGRDFDKHAPELRAALNDINYWGPAAFNSPLEKISSRVDMHTYKAAKSFVFKNFVALYSSDEKTCFIPKVFIDTATHMAIGVERTEQLFDQIIRRLKGLGQQLRMDASLISESVFVAAALGFVAHVAHETSVLHGTIRPAIPSIRALNDALEFDFTKHWSSSKLLAVGAVGGVAVLGAAIVAAPVAAAVAALAALVPKSIVAASVAGAAIAGIVTRKTKHKAGDPFAGYISDRKPCYRVGETIHFKSSVPLPATNPVLPDFCVDDIDPTATMMIRNLDSADPTKTPLHLLGIGNRFKIPITFAQSGLSEAVAIFKRVVKTQPRSTLSFDIALWEEYEDTMDACSDFFMPGWDGGLADVDLNFDHWLDGRDYSQSVKADYRTCHTLIEAGAVSTSLWENTTSNLFVKMEITRKIDATPRAIQAQSIWTNVVTGPPSKATGALLEKVWPMKHHGPGIYYAGGATPEQVGELVTTIVRSGDYCIAEGDFVKYDSSQHDLIFRRKHKHYTRAGRNCRDPGYGRFLTTLRKGLSTHGKTRNGNSYSVNATVSSGKQDTTGGNSLGQGEPVAFCAAKTIGCTVEQLFNTIGVYIIVYGDDNLIFVPRSLYFNITVFTDMMKRLGLEVEMVWHDGPNPIWDCSFCSQKFWPTTVISPANKKYNNIGYVLGPDLERTMCTLGYYVNPPPNMPPERLIRGDMIGRSMAGHVPFYRTAVNRMLNLTNGHVAWFDKKRKHGVTGHERHHTVCDETWQMLFHLYKLTKDAESKFASDLSSVKSMPAICDSSAIARLYVDYQVPDCDVTSHVPTGPLPIKLQHPTAVRKAALAMKDLEFIAMNNNAHKTSILWQGDMTVKAALEARLAVWQPFSAFPDDNTAMELLSNATKDDSVSIWDLY